jgi:hypothetical protein
MDFQAISDARHELIYGMATAEGLVAIDRRVGRAVEGTVADGTRIG